MRTLIYISFAAAACAVETDGVAPASHAYGMIMKERMNHV